MIFKVFNCLSSETELRELFDNFLDEKNESIEFFIFLWKSCSHHRNDKKHSK